MKLKTPVFLVCMLFSFLGTAHGQQRWQTPLTPATQPLEPPSPPSPGLFPIIFDTSYVDSSGDNLVVDKKAKIDLEKLEVGTNGEVVAVRITFSKDSTVETDLAGYIFIDSDLNPKTGKKPSRLYGLKSQDKDMGYDYYLDLFNLTFSRVVTVRNGNDEIVGSFLGELTGNTVTLYVPAAFIKSSSVKIAAVFGDQYDATDWGPENGGLELKVFKTTVLPTDTKFLASQGWDLGAFIENTKSVKIFYVSCFLDGEEFNWLTVSELASSASRFVYIDFGRRFATKAAGEHQVVVAVLTSRGFFVEEVNYRIIK